MHELCDACRDVTDVISEILSGDTDSGAGRIGCEIRLCATCDGFSVPFAQGSPRCCYRIRISYINPPVCLRIRLTANLTEVKQAS